MNIVLANDHGAVELSKKISEHLEAKGHKVNWLGVQEEKSVDYPDMAELACKEYLNGDYDFGILCCGTGIGISISANKINGIRCALPQNIFASQMAKQHNNVNFIAFGGRIEYQEDPLDMLDTFINEDFAAGRHERRVSKMMALEK
jgi:ribose 5-phosphate isomerase B